MEEIRATLGSGAAGGDGQAPMLPSSGLNWTVPALYKRYGFLRKLKEEVFFDLLYYPYWVLRFREELAWRFLGKRVVEQLRVLDARSGKSQKLIQAPDRVFEHVVFAAREDIPQDAQNAGEHAQSPQKACADLGKEAGEGMDWSLPADSGRAKTGTTKSRVFAPATVFRNETVLVRARTHIAQCRVTESQALERAYNDAKRDMGRFYNRPLGFMATMTSLAREAVPVCKPFWIMRSQSHRERLFVFDASTGLGGVAEYWNVVDYLTSETDGGEE